MKLINFIKGFFKKSESADLFFKIENIPTHNAREHHLEYKKNISNFRTM